MLTVVPMGKVNFTTSSDSLASSLATLMETHIVALLDDVENATSMASFTLRKYLRGLNHPMKYPILGRVINACIPSPRRDTQANGRSSIMLSIQLFATTHDTIANTQIGVSLITQEINVRIQLLSVSVRVLS